MAGRITYDDKVLGAPSSFPENKKWTFGNGNEVKTIINSHADDIEDLQNPEFTDYKTGLVDPVHQEGRLFYCDGEKTLCYYNDESDTTVNIGQELIIKVANNSGVNIANGDVVRVTGSSGGFPEVEKALADTVGNARVSGIATHDINNLDTGYITLIGVVRGLDTSGFSEGDTLYLSGSTDGELTNVEQQILSPVALVKVSDASNGQIYVRPTGVVNRTSIGQGRGRDEVQTLNTTPAKCYSFDINKFEKNTNVTQVQNPAGGGEIGYSAEISPLNVGDSGFYEFSFSVTISATGNDVHIFELYVDGVASGFLGIVDLSNNNIDAGSTSFTGITETVLTNSNTVEIYAYTVSSPSTVTYESALVSIKKIGNV